MRNQASKLFCATHRRAQFNDEVKKMGNWRVLRKVPCVSAKGELLDAIAVRIPGATLRWKKAEYLWILQKYSEFNKFIKGQLKLIWDNESQRKYELWMAKPTGRKK